MTSGYDGAIRIATKIDNTGLVSGVQTMKSTLNGLKGSIASLGTAFAAALGPAMALGAILAAVSAFKELGSQAISLASDLAEVQNVVDTAFGDMAYMAEDFAATSIKQFGMSRLAAKQTAANFMAMGNSMGLSKQAAADMAISVARLSGDVASYFNISQDLAKVRLRGIWTGETEALKELGVVMTETNLEEYALAKGIKTAYREMTQAERVTLRYQYVTEALGDAQGDFAKTSESWANQTRILSEQWKELLGLLGNGLIKVLKPVVKALNSMLAQVISIVQNLGLAQRSLREIMEEIRVTGNSITSMINNFIGVTTEAGDSAGDAADKEEDLAAGIGSAAKAADKALASFDDLNKLQNNMGGGGGAGILPGETKPHKATVDVTVNAPDGDKLRADIGAKLQDILVTLVPQWPPETPAPPAPPAVTVEYVPQVHPLPDPVFNPKWGLEPPVVESPVFPPIPAPVYEPEYGLTSPLARESATVTQTTKTMMDTVMQACATGFMFVTASGKEALDNLDAGVAEALLQGNVLSQHVDMTTANVGANVAAMAQNVADNLEVLNQSASVTVGNMAGSVSGTVYNLAKNVTDNVIEMVTAFHGNIGAFAQSSAETMASWGNAISEAAYQTAVNMNRSMKSAVENLAMAGQALQSSLANAAPGANRLTSSLPKYNWKDIAMTVAAATAIGVSIAVAPFIPALPVLFPAISAGAAFAGAGANGAIIPPNNPALLMVGDQKSGVNVESPLSTIEEAVERVLARQGVTGKQDIQVSINFTGDLSQVARILKPELDRASKLAGVRLVNRGTT